MADVAGPRTVSLVLPVHNQADHITGVVESYVNVAGRLGMDVDFILVANACTDDSSALCRQLAHCHERVHVIEQSGGGWGRAVRAGLASADGELLGYTNCARTSPEMLALTLSYARAYPGVVIKANRRVRDSLFRRMGSLLYNLECRALFDLATWDVNGTPKLFPTPLTSCANCEALVTCSTLRSCSSAASRTTRCSRFRCWRPPGWEDARRPTCDRRCACTVGPPRCVCGSDDEP